MISRPAACILCFLRRCLPALVLLAVMAIGHLSPFLGCNLLYLWAVWVLYRAQGGRHVAALFGAVAVVLIGGSLRLAEVISDFGIMNVFDCGVLGAVFGYLVGGFVVAMRDLRDLERSPLNDGGERRS
jgi:hypothetical protein